MPVVGQYESGAASISSVPLTSTTGTEKVKETESGLAVPRTQWSLGLLAVALGTFEATHPIDCQCAAQPRIGPTPVDRPPQPEGMPASPMMTSERVSSAASDGSVTVHPGVGELIVTGFAPAISVST